MGDEAKKAIATPPRKQSSPPLPPVQPLARAIITVLEYGTGKPLSGVRVEIWGKIFCSKESSPGVYPSDFPFTPGDAPVKLSKPGYGAVPKTTDKEAEPEYVETKPFPVGTSKYTFHLIDKSKAILVVTAQTPRKEAIPDAAVDLWNIDSIKTKSDGKVEYLVDLKTVSTRTPDNKLSVKVGKEDYGANTDPFVVPTLFEDKPWTPIPGARHEVNAVLERAEYHLHVDADRDGKVDDDRKGLDSWTFGAGNKGAIVLCNNDNDEGAAVPACDNADDKVNNGNDGDELAPLQVRRGGGAKVPTNWEAFLEIEAGKEGFVRVFDRKTAGAKTILGAGSPNARVFQLQNLVFAPQKEFWMEATRYAGPGFDGQVSITFRIKKKLDGGKTIEQVETAKFRVAPWIMPNHLDAAEKVYVVDDGTNKRFWDTDLRTAVTAAGCALEVFSSGDVWMQDCMEFGYSNLPTSGYRAVMRAPRNRPLQVFPKALLNRDMGYHEPGSLSPFNTFDSTGNLEATPPVTNKAGKKFPFGRIYFGGVGRGTQEIDPETREFLQKQIVQAPISIDTSWLTVGHVDEILSFVPAGGSKGFKMLIASPRLAFRILADQLAAHGTAKMLISRKFPNISGTSAEVSIKDFLSTGIPAVHARLKQPDLKSFNDDVQKRLDKTRNQLESELGLGAGDILEVPAIFAELEFATRADALTAGMVNMLVINKHCVFAKPFGPEVNGKDLFEEDLKGKLAALGLTPHPIDDWYEYHVALGEVHCGTNTLRAPTASKWWEFTP